MDASQLSYNRDFANLKELAQCIVDGVLGCNIQEICRRQSARQLMREGRYEDVLDSHRVTYTFTEEAPIVLAGEMTRHGSESTEFVVLKPGSERGGGTLMESENGEGWWTRVIGMLRRMR